jgi:hypothetical protein
MLILGQRHLRNALAEYARHYNGRRTKGYSRNPRSVSQATPSTTPIERRQVLGGLMNTTEQRSQRKAAAQRL